MSRLLQVYGGAVEYCAFGGPWWRGGRRVNQTLWGSSFLRCSWLPCRDLGFGVSEYFEGKGSALYSLSCMAWVRSYRRMACASLHMA